MKPFVSIIIPTYNRSYCIGRAIASVLKQTYQNFELIIVDDGSTDNTRKVVTGFRDSHIRYYRHTRNRGVLAAKNTGLDHANGAWIGILDSDDELIADTLHLLTSKLRELGPKANTGTIIGNCLNSLDNSFSGKGVISDGFICYEDFLCGRVHGEFWGLFSKEVLGERRFDERLRGFESILWYDLYKRSTTYYIHTPARIYHRENTDTISSFESMIQDAEKMVHCYSRLLEIYGEDLRRLCLQRYNHYLCRKAFYEIISGHRVQGVSTLFKTAYIRLSFETLVLLFALFLPRNAIVWLARIKQGGR